MAIPVSVVTGFLGAGKTTLLERWVRPEMAVIINERGAIGFDAERLGTRSARLREITGGCVCCQTQRELALALQEVVALRPSPSRVLIETSGAASPAGVVRALVRGAAAGALRLDGILTALDASRYERALQLDLATEQLAFADVVLLTHADRCAPERLREAEAEVGGYAPSAVIASVAPEGPCELEPLLARRGSALRLPDAGAHSPIDAVALIADAELDEARFGDWVEGALGAVEARLMRVKGIVAIRGIDARVILQGVGESVEVSLGAPWENAKRESRMVVLGLDLEGDALRAGFEGCVAG